MIDPVVDVKGISKQYPIGAGRRTTMGRLSREVVWWPYRKLRGKPARIAFSKRETFWALREVTFSIDRGEVTGIIGSNGAGKSTLLKVLSRIIYPTEGEARIHGRVSSLLEVGTGFNANLSGRENVFLNASLHGLTRREITAKFDAIVEFSGVGKFIDSPVKNYSSGMYSRLAFSVAAHLDPDILFVDEVLSVGDLAFQQKCLNKFSEIVSGNRTVLFVSHNLSAVSNICSQVIWLHQGRVQYFGPTEKGIAAYYQAMVPAQAESLEARHDRMGTGYFRFSGISFYDDAMRPCERIASGQELVIGLKYTALPERLGVIREMNVAVVLKNDKGHRLFGMPSEILASSSPDRIERRGECLVRIKRLPLVPGIYDMDLGCIINRMTTDKIISAKRIVVTEADYYGTGRLTSQQMGDILVDFEISWR